MLNKDEVLKALQEEREFAVKINEPKMALGIAQAMQVIREMEEKK